jgi:hypothetical protein
VFSSSFTYLGCESMQLFIKREKKMSANASKFVSLVKQTSTR